MLLGSRRDIGVTPPLPHTILCGVYSCCKSCVWERRARRGSPKAAGVGSAREPWREPPTRRCRLDPAAPQPEQSRGRALPLRPAQGRRRDSSPALPVGRDVAETRGSPAEKRPEALGDGEEQRLLRPAEEERPRGADRPDLR